MNCSIRFALLFGLILLVQPLAFASPDGEPPQAQAGWLGVVLDMEHTGPGAAVSRPFPDSPAALAGITPDSVITAVDGQAIADNQDLIVRVGSRPAGSSLAFTIAGSPPRIVHVILAARPANPANYAERMIGQDAPPLTVRSIASGESRALTPRDGKVRILEFWATWCPACQQAMPRLASAVASLPSEQFELLVVSGESQEIIAPFAAEHPQRDHMVQSDDEEANEAYWVGALPSYFLIDQSGSIVGFSVGANGWARLVEQASQLVGE